jgi:hypothetical protein
MRRGFGLALLLAACGGDDVEPELLEHRFASRPVRILASAELPDECQDALVEAVLWYRPLGATLTVEVAPPSARALQGIAVGGEVGVVPGFLSTNVRGETRIALTPGGDVFAAEITLATCDALTVAHEAGHALGLVHVDSTNLMHRAIDHADWLLNNRQILWVRDDPYSTQTSFAMPADIRWEDIEHSRVTSCY